LTQFHPLPPGDSLATVWGALHGLFETLRSEQRESGLGVMMVCPGFTRTGIEAHALGGDGGALRAPRNVYGRQADPDEVADAIFRAALRRRRLLVLSPVGKLAYAVSRIWPSLFERMMIRRMRVALHASPSDEPQAD